MTQLDTYRVALKNPATNDSNVSTHVAASKSAAKRIAREEFCSDFGHPFKTIHNIQVITIIKLTGDK